MIWAVEWTEEASRDMERLDRRMAERVLHAVDRFTQTGYGDVVRLKGYDAEWRLRVGAWRVRFTLDSAVRILMVLSVRPRGSAYRE